MAAPQLFGIIPAGCPMIINPSSVPSETSFIFTLPARPFSHIVVFLLPGVTLPPDTAAAVYLAIPDIVTSSFSASNPQFKFLGGFGTGKESVIFKISGSSNDHHAISINGEMDKEANEGQISQIQACEMILGISVESESSVATQMTTLSTKRTNPTITEPSHAVSSLRSEPSNTLQLGQKIIKNAFNFLASFSGDVPVPGAAGTAGVEVVPLKAFEDWWKKFEGRLRTDPGFLERDND